jgi:hypothetical protein
VRPGATVERFVTAARNGRWVERRRNLHARTVADAERLIRAMGDGFVLEREPWRLLDSDGFVVAASGFVERLLDAGSVARWD